MSNIIYDHNKIIDLYQSGYSTREVAKIVGCGKTLVCTCLKQNNIEVKKIGFYREKSRKYKINENFFEKIDTPEKAYILGFLYADGYMKKDSLKFELCLQEKDKNILETINRVMNYEKPLRFIKKRKKSWQNSYQLLISCKKMCYDLIKYGFISNRTFNCDFPEFLDEELKRHFVRGFFDGDGCAYVDKNGITNMKSLFIGYYKMIEDLQKYLLSYNINSKISKHKTENITNLSIYGIDNNINFYNLIYKGSTIHLDRKHDKFIEFFKKQKKFPDEIITIFNFNKI